MNISNPIINYNVSALATATRGGSNSSITLLQSTVTNVPSDADVVYISYALLAGNSAVNLSLTSGDLSPSSWTAPVRQVELIIASGTITTAGNAYVDVITNGSLPYRVEFAVELNDTAIAWAAKCRTALSEDANISSLYDVGGGTGTNITLTKKPLATYVIGDTSVEMAYANDATHTIEIGNATCAGITSGASTDFIVGVVGNGRLLFNDYVDFEGITLQTLSNVYGLLIEHTTLDANDQQVDYVIGTEYSGRLYSTTEQSSTVLLSYPDTTSILDVLTATSASDTGLVKFTVIGKV